jgi:CBS domain-containing protein
MKIKEMVKDVATVPSNARAHKAVKPMNKNKIGCLLIVDYSQTTGILTKRDILTGVVEKRKDPQKTKILEIMTKHVIVGNPIWNSPTPRNLCLKIR